MRDKTKLILIILLIVGGGMRLLNLDWGADYFFHPDERNIAGSVSQLRFPDQLNPNFFAYGSFPVYAYFFLTKICQLVSSGDTFSQSVIAGRWMSAIFSTMGIYLVYVLGKRWGKSVGIFAATLSAFSVGLVQYAHFSTVESLLSIGYLLIFIFLWRFLENRKRTYLVLAGVTTGVMIGTKITSGLILPAVVLTVLATRERFVKKIKGLGLFGTICIFSFLAVFPYSVLDWDGHKKAIEYEGGVATGKIQVFYVKQYLGSLPVVWHFKKVFPWSLGLAATSILPLAWAGVAGMTARWKFKKNDNTYIETGLLWLWVTIFFFWHTFLFVKWIRYMIPILPFLNLLIAIFLIHGLGRRGRWPKALAGVVGGVILGGNIYQSGRLLNIYRRVDTRVEMQYWAEKNIQRGESILSEVYDLGVIAMPDWTKENTVLFNFYDLDIEPREERLTELSDLLYASDWILVPSRRVYGNMKPESSLFNYYTKLFDGRLGFEKAEEFGINTFLDQAAEETYEVFDHPRIFIFKKTEEFSVDQYKNLIKR